MEVHLAEAETQVNSEVDVIIVSLSSRRPCPQERLLLKLSNIGVVSNCNVSSVILYVCLKPA